MSREQEHTSSKKRADHRRHVRVSDELLTQIEELIWRLNKAGRGRTTKQEHVANALGPYLKKHLTKLRTEQESESEDSNSGTRDEVISAAPELAPSILHSA